MGTRAKWAPMRANTAHLPLGRVGNDKDTVSLSSRSAIAHANNGAPPGACRDTSLPCRRAAAGADEDPLPSRPAANWAILGLTALAMMSYAGHCIWVTSEAYSSPSIVLISGWGPHRHVLDDFREAYYW